MTLRSKFGIVSAVVAGLACVPAHAADIYVIANSEMTLSADEAREAFVGTKQVAGNVKIVPFDNLAARKDFLERVPKMDLGKYETLWAKKSFREGLNPPATKGSDLEAISAVKATKGGLGYVTTLPGPGVTVVGKF